MSGSGTESIATAGITMQAAIAALIDRRDLTSEEMADIVGRIMDGEATPAQIGGLLIALRCKGETVGELVGAARAMRARMIAVPVDAPVVVDTCGTGGDGSGSVNISTLASFIVAACGVPVAKHGNRALSSHSGSHDVIEALGLLCAPTPELAARSLRETNLAFLFAPAYHTAMRHAAAPRRELGTRTVFNMLGPLTNPAATKFHVNGIFQRERCALLAEAHAQLGSRRALVVHGAGGLDEIAPAGETFVAELKEGAVRTYVVTPSAFGLDESDPRELRGGLPAVNAELMMAVLDRRPDARTAIRNAALMTAAAAVYVTGRAADLASGLRQAVEALDGGAARDRLEQLRQLTPLARSATPAAAEAR